MAEKPPRWRRTIITLVAGVLYLAASVFAVRADGGRDAALFYGTLGAALTFPILLGFGTLLAAGVRRVRTLGEGPRATIAVAPVLLLAGLLVREGTRARDPVARFERWVAAPVPASVRVESAFTYRGVNYWWWAFHFRIDPDDLPMVLGRHPYRHEVDPSGFDLAHQRDLARREPGYPVPPPGFRAVHRYRHHAPTGRVGYDLTLYGDAARSEFYAYGYVE